MEQTIAVEQFMRGTASSLNRIAVCLEYLVQKDRQRMADVDTDSLGVQALWREQVTRGETLLGFADWLAWHQAEKKETT